jgi:large subunit ribosomal protein L18
MKEQLKKVHRHWRRQHHIRKTLIGTAERPRLSVFRSVKHIYCQIIDDKAVDKNGNYCGKTLAACSTVAPSVRGRVKHGGNIEAARIVGEEIAKLAKTKGITKVAFDRAGYQYHGRVKALADAARQGGLEF